MVSGSPDYPTLSSNYRIRREIGRGGMAVVYLADDLRHDRQVAVKVLHVELSRAIGADRFSQEIRTVARLQHPNILALFDSGTAEGALYFVMPFVDGESLRDRIIREGTLTLADSTGILTQIGNALDYAHAEGVVHRDVKPENILLAKRHAFLADFGVARAQSSDVHTTLTSIGTALGTPRYMSPEQVSADPSITGRSDLYALGCVAYEMLAGTPPFSGPNAMAIMAQHIAQAPPALVGKHEIVPEAVVGAVLGMLAKDPASRPANAAEFSAILAAALAATALPSQVSLVGKKPATDAIRTVFVLDFTNVSGSPDADWLASGIAETVSVDLRKIRGIRVVGNDPAARRRAATEAGPGRIEAETARRLGRSVGAQWVVWGAYQKSGDRIRLTPQFSDVETGRSIGADKLDGRMEEIFELQDRIVHRLAEMLEVELTPHEVNEVGKPETSDLGAYELYARGKRAFLLFGRDSAQAADGFFRQAIALDPGYALAWAGLGSLLMPRYITSGSATVLDDGVAALQRAMELDPALGEPYVFLAYMYTQQHRYDEAIAAARTSLERDPGAFMGWYMLGLSLVQRGYAAGQLADLSRAIPPLLRCRAINPTFHPAHMVAGSIYSLRGDYGPATALIDQAVELERGGAGHLFLGSFVERALIHVNSGETTEAMALFDAAIAKYSGMDHVYAETMTAWATTCRGCLAERLGDHRSAESDFLAAVAIAEENEHRLGIGAHWIRAKLGLARLAHRRAAPAESASLLDAAIEMRETKRRFVWINISGSTTADSHYAIAATHMMRGEFALGLSALESAVRHGWADRNQLAYDPNFDVVRDDPAVLQLLAHSDSQVTLPHDLGSGGFPDFGESTSPVPSSPSA